MEDIPLLSYHRHYKFDILDVKAGGQLVMFCRLCFLSPTFGSLFVPTYDADDGMGWVQTARTADLR